MNGESPYRMGNLSDSTGAGEAGAVENKITLNPNDPRWKDTVGEWKDGEEYSFEHVKVRQISAGEFEVLSADVEGGEQKPDVETEASQRASEKSENPEYDNPAVENL
jgi:hypothetical protein